ncbi:MAG: hypothetical protein JEZ11_05290 [Desulfobacterales bacterium]|nr:hypothetical protein [Desulfobacterales bacterium]
MVTVGFVVEGASEAILIKSPSFRTWLEKACRLELLEPVVDTGGKGEMCSTKITSYVNKLRIQAQPEKLVVLADLDPEVCAPCISVRKEIIGTENIDLVVIARKALESWFLADTKAMRKWLRDGSYFEELPEETDGMPWERLRMLGKSSSSQRGPGRKVPFARKFIHRCGFEVQEAATHENCPSASYFVDKLKLLGETV